MMADYVALVYDMNLEGIIQMIAHIKTIPATETSSSNSGRVELWQKLQMVLVKAFEFRHEDFEYAEKG